MSRQFITGNVVIAAEQFNPTILGQIWLAKVGLVPPDGFRDGCIFTDAVAQVRAREFDLMVIPQLAQFVANVERERQQEVIVEKLGLFVRKLPETPYRALGFNLIWHVAPANSTVEDLSRRLFRVPDGPVHRFFDDGNSRFGSYLSKDSLGFRLKLTALPVLVPPVGNERQHLVSFNFNYHFDIPAEGDVVGSIMQMLGRWNDAVAESSRIVEAAGE